MRRKYRLRVWTGVWVVLSGAVAMLLWAVLPMLTGYGAKVMCSAVFVSGRAPGAVAREDLGRLPFSLGSFTVDLHDSSVTGTVWGMAKSRAIYRRGLGATLVRGVTEAELRRVAGGYGVGRRHDSAGLVMDTSFAVAAGGAALERAVDGMFFREDRRDSNGTRAVVVVYKGRIVAERYAAGFRKDMPLAGWSMAKSVTNALMGILARAGKLDVHAAAGVPEWEGDDRRKITIEDLMRMRSGLRWWECYGLPDACTRMLFLEKDMGVAAARSRLRHSPGEVFNYSSGTVNILSKLVRDRVDADAYYRWPYEQLFYKIGMNHAVLEPDAGGTFVGSSYCYATAREWARFGMLYLYDGVWNGERILPEGWVKLTAEGEDYGALWWLNKGGRWPHIPRDCMACEGYEGQYVWVIPSRDIVVVRLALQNEKLAVDRVLAGIVRALGE